MSALMSHILPLAAGAAISPTILTLSVLVLSGPHGKARQTIFTAVNVGLMALIAVFGANALRHVSSHRGGGSHATTEAIYVTLGIVLVLLAIREHFQPAKDTEKDDAANAAKGTGLSPLRYVSLGVVMTATNFTTLALFIPALHEIAISTASSSDRVIAGIILVVMATLTAWLPLLATVVAPGPAARALSAIHDFTTKYKHQIVEVVLLVFGVYMIIKGLGKH